MKERKLEKIFQKIKEYQLEKFRKFGPSFRGADWNSKEAQEIRFEQLLKVCDLSRRFSINSYGCGYGALFGYMLKKNYNFKYFGYDVLEELISEAKNLYKNYQNCHFSNDKSKLPVADYTLASGLFNLKFEATLIQWKNFILETLFDFNRLSKKGFAFNMLTKYSDFYRKNLYYGNPCFYFDYCKKNFSKDVALLHDYSLYDFTILVRK